MVLKEEEEQEEKETIDRIQKKLNEIRNKRQDQDRIYASNPNISAEDSGFTSPT
jgi:hypothetical protein